MIVKDAQLKHLQDALKGDPYNIVSRQGTPHGGWVMPIKLRGVPCFLVGDWAKGIFNGYQAAVNTNDLGQDYLHSRIYAEWAINMLMQCRAGDRGLFMPAFLTQVTWPSSCSVTNWLSLKGITLDLLLEAEEFHKHAIERVWGCWLVCALTYFDPPGGIRAELFQRRLAVRDCQTKEEVQEQISQVKAFVEANWLP